MQKTLLIIVMLFIVTGCASQSERLARHGRVIPKPDGFYEASGTHVDQNTALRIALASAEQTCKPGSFVVYEQDAVKDEALVDERVAKTADLIAVAAFQAGRHVPGGNMLRGKNTESLLFRCE